MCWRICPLVNVTHFDTIFCALMKYLSFISETILLMDLRNWVSMEVLLSSALLRVNADSFVLNFKVCNFLHVS